MFENAYRLGNELINFMVINKEFFLFLLFLSIFCYIKRSNLEIKGKFPFFYILMYKSKFGINLMKKVSTKFPTTILYFAYVSFFIGIFGMILSFFFMGYQTYFIYENKIESGGGFVLPIKTEGGLDSNVPIFYVPFLEWIIALIVLVLVHEFAHGVVSKRFNIKIKSSGFAFLGVFAPILPAAFVEPDEKQLKKSKFFEKISILGAGSTSNFLFGAIFGAILFLMILFSNNISTSNMYFNEVSNKSSLNQYGIKSGQILQVNEEKDARNFLTEIKDSSINNSVEMKIIDQNNKTQMLNVNLYYDEISDRNMVGISQIKNEKNYFENYEIFGKVIEKTIIIIFWIFILNIAIGFVNLLPISITDGGQILFYTLNKYFDEKTSSIIFIIVSLSTLFLLILSIWPKILF